eukprot:12103816-Heterocapsa_arctica.AAC.1
MHGIVLDDDKGRFQLGVLVAEPDVLDPTMKLRAHAIYAMRAVNGHSHRIDQTKIATPVTEAHFDLMSAITHKTQSRHLPGIIKFGILPGGHYVDPGAPGGLGDRFISNLCAFLPTDPRNVAVGRPGKEYDAVIILKKSVLSALQISMNHND